MSLLHGELLLESGSKRQECRHIEQVEDAAFCVTMTLMSTSPEGMVEDETAQHQNIDHQSDMVEHRALAVDRPFFRSSIVRQHGHNLVQPLHEYLSIIPTLNLEPQLLH